CSVIGFCLGHGLTGIVYWPDMLFLTLPQDYTNGKVASVAHELKGPIPVRSFSQFSFECLKGFNTLFGEKEWGIFFEKTGHWPGYF
nr:hypothetical protein [Tanacetum cinerariifolium]